MTLRASPTEATRTSRGSRLPWTQAPLHCRSAVHCVTSQLLVIVCAGVVFPQCVCIVCTRVIFSPQRGDVSDQEKALPYMLSLAAGVDRGRTCSSSVVTRINRHSLWYMYI